MDRLYEWIVDHHGIDPPSSPLSRACTCAINQREALMRYLDDGRLPIDNTGAERALAEGWPEDRLGELLPHRWAATRAELEAERDASGG
jgi:hypothetical protein